MAYPRIYKASSWNPLSQQKGSRLGPRPFVVQAKQGSNGPPTQEEIEDETFQQHAFEAFGLELKKKYGTMTPEEGEQLNVLQAKRNDFWAQRMERARRQPGFFNQNARLEQEAHGSSPIQRREIGATSDLSPSESDQVKKLLSPGKGESPKPLEGAVIDKGLKELRKALYTVASAGVAGYNSKRDPGVDVSPGTSYDKVLKLTIKKVLAKYGLYLAEAAKEGAGTSTLQATPDQIRLHQADTPWAAVKADAQNREQTILSEAKLSAQYLVDTNPVVQGAFIEIMKDHDKDDPVSVEQAYLDKLFSVPDGDLATILAEYRLRWAPLTKGSDIYIAPEKNVNYFDTWTNYKYLVHEVMHTAAHSKFEKYLDEEVPAEVANVIREGTVDYFAQVLWEEIVDGVKANTSSTENATVHGIRSEPSKDKVDKTLKGKLEAYKKRPLYTQQVPVIQSVISALTNGEERLKAAFFYGDVYHVFPKYTAEHEESTTPVSTTAKPSVGVGSEKKKTLKALPYVDKFPVMGTWQEDDWLGFKHAIYGLVSKKDWQSLLALQDALDSYLDHPEALKMYKEISFQWRMAGSPDVGSSKGQQQTSSKSSKTVSKGPMEQLEQLRATWRANNLSGGNPPAWDDTWAALESTLNPPPFVTPSQVLEEQQNILLGAKSRWGL